MTEESRRWPFLRSGEVVMVVMGGGGGSSSSSLTMGGDVGVAVLFFLENMEAFLPKMPEEGGGGGSGIVDGVVG